MAGKAPFASSRSASRMDTLQPCHVGIHSHRDQLAGFVKVPCFPGEAIAAVRGPKRAASSDGTCGGAVAAGCFHSLEFGYIPACFHGLKLGRIRQTLVSRAKFLERSEAEGISGWRKGLGRLAWHQCHQQACEHGDEHDVSLRLPSNGQCIAEPRFGTAPGAAVRRGLACASQASRPPAASFKSRYRKCRVPPSG
jgi:hypothetical protein